MRKLRNGEDEDEVEEQFEEADARMFTIDARPKESARALRMVVCGHVGRNATDRVLARQLEDTRMNVRSPAQGGPSQGEQDRV